MSQHDYIIANQNFPATRVDINNALQALASTSSGPTSPSPTYANQLWYDTTNNILKIRNEANSVWINLLRVNQSTNRSEVIDGTLVTTSGGATVGELNSQAIGTWQAGVSTLDSLVSPAKIKAAVLQVLSDEGLI